MIRAYHFVGDKLRDKRQVPPDGEWLVHDGPVKMRESGLHASRHPFDALTYAPGPILCLVDCDGIDAEENDKLVCRRRRIVAKFDATTMLRAFARQCALDVIYLWDAPQVVRDYLTTGDESLRAAASAAASAAAKDAAWAVWAAKDAALDAARGAAWGAVRDARDDLRERFARLVTDHLASHERRENEE